MHTIRTQFVFTVHVSPLIVSRLPVSKTLWLRVTAIIVG